MGQEREEYIRTVVAKGYTEADAASFYDACVAGEAPQPVQCPECHTFPSVELKGLIWSVSCNHDLPGKILGITTTGERDEAVLLWNKVAEAIKKVL